MTRSIKPHPPTPAPKRFEIDRSGKSGVNGRDGSDGSSGYSGADGSDGTDASAPTRGANGGNIDLDLSVTKKGDQFELGVIANGSAGESPTQAGEFLPAGSEIYLSTKGGQGGDGADGGDGGDGGRGSDGSDATRYSRGEDGERGGDGGDAGRGTSGADGGRGGDVRVRVAETDTDALAAVKAIEVEGGEGGRKGNHGSAGSGGSGGSGGSSYSWSETDSQGRTESGSNSGGSSGSSGSGGSSAGSYLSAGERGDDGRATIEVAGRNGVRSFNDRYRVVTSGTTLKDANEDGIFEPGEKASLQVSLKNTGPMETPSAPLSGRLEEGEWVQGVQSKPLPASIAPGDSTTVTDLGFTIAPDTQVHDGEGLDAKTEVRSEVMADRVGAVLDESRANTGFNVKYPVQISAITGDRTATRDEPAKVSWEVKNISQKALGADSESRRLVESMLKVTGGDAAAEHLLFMGPDGKEQKLAEGIGRAIANLGPGKSVKIEGSIAFAPQAPFHSQVELSALLDVGAMDAPSKAKTIQSREFSVQLARTYAADGSAGVLVVTNNRTTKEEIAAWEQLAQDFGTKANLWNISLYGSMSLTEAINGQELGPQFAKKTVVILNNEYDPEQGVSSPIGHLGDRDLLVAAVKAHTRSLVLGGDTAIKEQLSPKGLTGEVEHFNTRKEHAQAVSEHRAATDADFGTDEVQVQVWGTASRAKLEKQAAKIVDTLRRENPDRRYYANANYRPERDDSMLSWFKRHEAGTVKVTRSADFAQNVVLHQAATDVHDVAYLHSAQHRYALAKSLTLPLKLQALQTLAGQQPSSPNLTIVFKALLADLAEEQQALRDREWNGQVSREELHQKLVDLAQVSAFFKDLEPNSPAGSVVLDLIAEVGHMTQQAKTFWDFVLPARRNTSLDAVSDQMIDGLTRQAFGDGPPDAVREALAERAAALKARDAGLTQPQRAGMASYLKPAELWSDTLASDFDV